MVLLRILIAAGLISFASHAIAGITLTDVEGASNFTGIGSNNEEGDQEVIFGGMGGDDCTNLASSTSATCSNCAAIHGADFTSVCNDTRIYPTLLLKIKFSSDNTDGTPALAQSDGTVITGLSLDSTSTGSLSQGSTHTAVVAWQDICSGLLGITGTCEGDASETMSVGVDKNGDGDLADSDDDKTTLTIQVKRTIDSQTSSSTLHCDDPSISNTSGICNFSVFPGDQKVFVKTLQAPTGFPSASDPNFIEVRLYFSEGGSFSAINHTSTFATLEVTKNDDGTIEASPDAVSELTNGTQYFFRIATVDQAKNVGFHSPITRTDTSTDFHNTTDHAATPSPVSALLTDDLQCFVATAAYGTPFKKNVKLLRRFRNQVLNKSWFGQKLIDAYYLFSPPLADAISQRPWARKLTRVALLPAVFLARLTLDWGVAKTLLIMMAGLLAIALSALTLRRRVLKAKA